MRTTTIGGSELKFAASPLTPFIYKKEFGSDLFADIALIRYAVNSEGEIVDASAFRMFDIVQMLWAMVRTVDPKTVGFESWLLSLPEDALDVASLDVGGVMAELTRCFFRGSRKAKAEAQDNGDAEPAVRDGAGTGDAGDGSQDGPDA